MLTSKNLERSSQSLDQEARDSGRREDELLKKKIEDIKRCFFLLFTFCGTEMEECFTLELDDKLFLCFLNAILCSWKPFSSSREVMGGGRKHPREPVLIHLKNVTSHHCFNYTFFLFVVNFPPFFDDISNISRVCTESFRLPFSITLAQFLILQQEYCIVHTNYYCLIFSTAFHRKYSSGATGSHKLKAFIFLNFL